MSETRDLFELAAAPDDDAITLADYAERAYLDYAISVVRGRALPDVCDGQKPVQRRILYAMHEMGLGPAAKPVKSARVVGDVLGKFHPHGDTAAYDAMVRMAQGFSLRYPLIDGQGNFGSRDGDGAAAMRYTEARLTRYAALLLDEIDQGTVDFAANYDGAFQEPLLLPARLPMVLLNGASGIAVGMATEIPPHNLREVAAAAVAALRNPKITTEEVLAHLPAPDFPGGGQIISDPETITAVYESGRGSIKLRARYHFEELARAQWQLVIDELPHGVSAQKVLEEIEELSNPKVRTGRKSLTSEQQQLRQGVLAVLDTVRDEAGKDAAVRLVFEPRSSKVDREELVRVLLAHTGLETSVAINLVMIGIDGRPHQKGLAEILVEWGQFRLHTVTRRCRHRLGKVEDRIHILEGRRLVLLDIDEVIRIIRASDEPGPALRARFQLSERQVEDILEIRLRQLARLEAIRIEQELDKLQAERAELEKLLASPVALKRLVIREIEADAKAYGDERRSLVEAAERTSIEIPLSDDPVTVIISDKGWVRARQGHGHDWSQFGFKTGDQLDDAFEVRESDTLIVVASNGRVYSHSVAQLPSARGDGAPLTSLIELEAGSRIAFAFAARLGDGVLLASRRGYGFRCKVADLVGRTRQGKVFLALGPDDEPLRPAVFQAGEDQVLCISAEGRALVFALEEIKSLHKGGRGVILMGLEARDMLAQAQAFGKDGVLVSGTARGARQIERPFGAGALAAWKGARARKGRFLEPRIKDARLRLPRAGG